MKRIDVNILGDPEPHPWGADSPDVLSYYDCPLTWITRRPETNLLWWSADRKGGKHFLRFVDLYMVVPISPEDEAALRNNLLTCRDALTKQPMAWLAAYSNRHGWQAWEIEAFPEKWLPDNGYRLSL